MTKEEKQEIKDFYEDNGWKATISKYKIAPKNLSVVLGKKKASKKTPKKNAKKNTKKNTKAKKSSTKTKAKKTAKPNPQALIENAITNLQKLSEILQAA